MVRSTKKCSWISFIEGLKHLVTVSNIGTGNNFFHHICQFKSNDLIITDPSHIFKTLAKHYLLVSCNLNHKHTFLSHELYTEQIYISFYFPRLDNSFLERILE